MCSERANGSKRIKIRISCIKAQTAARVRVVWLRVYPNEAQWKLGEELVAESTGKLIAAESRAFADPISFKLALESGELDDIWGCASEIFLAPWIFGIYEHEAALLALANRVQRHFWVMTEYGRGVGPIHAYSGGLASRIRTGWPEGGVNDSDTSIFKTILKAPVTGTNWRRHFAAKVGIPITELQDDQVPVRLWWAYSRKDSASVHEFRLLEASEGRSPDHGQDPVPKVAKIIPVKMDGSLADGKAKNMGELLKEKVDEHMKDPSDHGNSELTDEEKAQVRPAAESAAHIAGQFSKLLLHIIGKSPKQKAAEDQLSTADVIVAPNIRIQLPSATSREHDSAVAKVVQITGIDLVYPNGKVTRMKLPQQIFMVAERVPRHEMRTFLENCEPAVVVTGDQSVAEAALLGKLPLWRPDAKVEEWEKALAAVASGAVEQVQDLGERLRLLLVSSDAREKAKQRSFDDSLAVEESLRASFGGRKPEPSEEILIRAGMFG
eukprot:TRINITY_DN16721_c0_g1_i5.p1 TRINITY_DN16721_c0_g1~~TRINITY_DN16721_c0_g1_i5.p1  ORF type:complete len:495 (-),score=112.02 TRINITY_DN16721_c0_g1_i5:629-2113(-)